jgi:hypothetical protein
MGSHCTLHFEVLPAQSLNEEQYTNLTSSSDVPAGDFGIPFDALNDMSYLSVIYSKRRRATY